MELDLPIADQAAFAASARVAIDSHPSSPQQAWEQFSDAGANAVRRPAHDTHSAGSSRDGARSITGDGLGDVRRPPQRRQHAATQAGSGDRIPPGTTTRA